MKLPEYGCRYNIQRHSEEYVVCLTFGQKTEFIFRYNRKVVESYAAASVIGASTGDPHKTVEEFFEHDIEQMTYLEFQQHEVDALNPML